MVVKTERGENWYCVTGLNFIGILFVYSLLGAYGITTGDSPLPY